MKLDVNGRVHEVEAEPATPLLYVLREDLKLNGAKFGCGLGQCGACTVLADSEAIFSCLTPISVVQGRRITTVEGLGTVEKPGPLQRAFIELQAAQCGYCIPGMMMRTRARARRRSATRCSPTYVAAARICASCVLRCARASRCEASHEPARIHRHR